MGCENDVTNTEIVSNIEHSCNVFKKSSLQSEKKVSAEEKELTKHFQPVRCIKISDKVNAIGSS